MSDPFAFLWGIAATVSVAAISLAVAYIRFRCRVAHARKVFPEASADTILNAVMISEKQDDALQLAGFPQQASSLEEAVADVAASAASAVGQLLSSDSQTDEPEEEESFLEYVGNQIASFRRKQPLPRQKTAMQVAKDA